MGISWTRFRSKFARFWENLGKSRKIWGYFGKIRDYFFPKKLLFLTVILRFFYTKSLLWLLTSRLGNLHSPRICSRGYSDWNWPTSGNQAAWFAAITYANEQGTKHLLNAPKFCMAFTAFITNIDQYICLKENNQSFNAIQEKTKQLATFRAFLIVFLWKYIKAIDMHMRLSDKNSYGWQVLLLNHPSHCSPSILIIIWEYDFLWR